MAGQKHCIRCGRAIDAYARICPYCNWDQTEPVPAAAPFENAMPAYVPPADHRIRNAILLAVGGVLLLVAAFGIGSLVHGRNPTPAPSDKEATTAAKGSGKPSPRANVTLVPDTESSPDIEQPITSAPLANPAEGVPTEYQRTDATAASSAEYAQMAQRAKAEKKKSPDVVDPRTITTPAVSQQQTPPPQTSASSMPPASAPPPATSVSTASQPPPAERQVNFPSEPAKIVISTRPVATYQPLPNISVRRPMTARLQLTVGKDGSVKEVNVIQGIPGETGKLVA
ncbi:MAG: hypothetical protein ACXVJO_16060, partial [Thermoanaerobaculia bacterium]